MRRKYEVQWEDDHKTTVDDAEYVRLHANNYLKAKGEANNSLPVEHTTQNVSNNHQMSSSSTANGIIDTNRLSPISELSYTEAIIDEDDDLSDR